MLEVKQIVEGPCYTEDEEEMGHTEQEASQYEDTGNGAWGPVKMYNPIYAINPGQKEEQ